jgi:hypothetical protein
VPGSIPSKKAHIRTAPIARKPIPHSAAGRIPTLGLEADLFALDAIELSLALVPWAGGKQDFASLKLNALLDLQTDIPVLCARTTENVTSVLLGLFPCPTAIT